MKPISRTALAAALQLAFLPATAAPLTLSNQPLFLTSNAKANVLMVYGNSNSMDSDPTGKAVGSEKATSKSEIARTAIKSVISGYTGYINMGLMAYQQNALAAYALHDSQYDVSYDPANYSSSFSGARNSATKKFRIANPSSPGNYIHYNVNLPFYAESNQGNRFCVSTTACTSPTVDFKGTAQSTCSSPENPVNKVGPWDSYTCYSSKTGTSDTTGYGGSDFTTQLIPTDSDFGQGITDFGKRLAWQYVGKAWFNDKAPGMGYLHVPIAALTASQAAKINTKLGTSQFVDNKPTHPDYPLQNAGLTPLEGTVMTAKAYFTGALTQAAQGGPQAAPPESCGKNFMVMLTDGLPSITYDGKETSNVATSLAALTTQVAALRSSSAKVESYVVGFALPYGVSATQLDTIAAAGGSGTAFNAADKDTLNTAFASIFSDIIAKTAAASAVALNSQSVAANAHVFQAKFSSGDWSGQLLDYTLNASGNLVTPAGWDAGQVINSQLPGDRVILTYKQAGKKTAAKGIPFRWPVDPAKPGANELDIAFSTALNTSSAGVVDNNGSARLDYLRGSAENEGSSGLKFRRRPTSKLGDIVNSAPHYVGVPSATYNASGYSAFRSSNASRTKMVYVGANDGMLHGFDAATGREKIAYVPTGVYGNLSRLTDANYSHRYFVDGSPASGDVYYGGAWHTVLVGTMGIGARGIFALDVTNPSSFSEANAASLVNFEFTEANDSDIGHIPGPVSIVKLNNGKWAALFGNGYNSGGSGESALFVVDIQTGELIKKITTGAGTAATPNGLATPLAIDSDNNLTVDVVYAGDLLGNVWRFDLSKDNPSQWKVDYKLYEAGQPITSGMDAGEHPNGGYMVYFGTGKYLEPSDTANVHTNKMFGIWDKGAAVTGALQQQVFTDIADIAGNGYRTATANTIDWTQKFGWYAQFPAVGERVVSDPVLRGGRVIFTSILPSTVECSPGGISWLNEVDWLNGGLLKTPPFDTNLDGKVDSSDTLVQARKLNSIASAPAIQRAPTGKNLELKFLNESSGEIAKVTESANPTSARRLSWRQVK